MVKWLVYLLLHHTDVSRLLVQIPSIQFFFSCSSNPQASGSAKKNRNVSGSDRIHYFNNIYTCWFQKFFLQLPKHIHSEEYLQLKCYSITLWTESGVFQFPLNHLVFIMIFFVEIHCYNPKCEFFHFWAQNVTLKKIWLWQWQHCNYLS